MNKEGVLYDLASNLTLYFIWGKLEHYEKYNALSEKYLVQKENPPLYVEKLYEEASIRKENPCFIDMAYIIFGGHRGKYEWEYEAMEKLIKDTYHIRGENE